MPRIAAGVPSCRPICSAPFAASSTRATSRIRTNEPSGSARSTTFPNSSTLASRPFGLDRQLELLVRQCRLRADTADRGLDILALERGDDVTGRHRVTGQPLRRDPDAHAVVPRRQQHHIAHAGESASARRSC